MIKLHGESEYYLNEKFVCSIDTEYDNPTTIVTMINGDEFKCIERPNEVLRLIQKEQSK